MRAKTLILSALAVCLWSAPVFGRAAEETARRYLTLAYEGLFDALPESADATTELFERRVRNALRVRCIGIEKIDVREATADAVWLEVTLRKSDRQSPDELLAHEAVSLRLKIGGDGLVSAVEFPDEELADRLLAGTDEEIRQFLRAHPDRLSPSLARAVYSRAITVLNYSRSSTAAEVSGKALRISALAREIAIAAGDRGGEALAVGIDSLDAWMQHQDYDRALLLGRESVALAQSAGDADVLARAWYNLSRAARTREERDECVRNSLAFAERAEDPYVLGRVLVLMASIANGQCDHLTARGYADRILAIARESKDIGGEINGEVLLSDIYDEQNDQERAYFHHLRALKLAERHHSRMYPALQILSAEYLVKQGRYDEARAMYAKALPRDERGAVVWNSVVGKSIVSGAFAWMAELAARTGQLDEAACLNAMADDPPQWLAPYYLRAGDVATALHVSLSSIPELANPGTRIQALTNAARAYRALGQCDRALATVEEALELREEIAHLIGGDEQQQVHEADRRAQHYELAAELALEQGDALAALAFLEHARARVLTDMLENGRPGAMEEADAANRNEQLRQERELTRISIEIDRARLAGDASAAQSLRRQLDDARAIYASFHDGVLARSQRRHSARRRSGPGELAAMLARLPAGTAAIEYFVDNDELHAFVVRPDGSVTHRKTSVSRKRVEERVSHFLQMLSRRDLRVRDAAREVHALLLQPIERDLGEADALLVIPDDVLWRVPFAALVDGRGRFLVERTAIVYAPSITAYMTMAEARATARPASFFAVGNPTLSQVARSNFTSFYRDASLDPLPDAEREVDAAGTLYDPRSVVLKGERATESATRSAIGGATIVHFATHALLDDSHPMYSRLALAPDGEVSDGWLESWEIARLDLDADMVVLSACETARGEIGAGEGVVGMAWSFFLAGARSTVATQWKIASRSTADLMIAFHRSLRAGTHAPSLHKAQALRDAQLTLLRDERYEHPFYWAAFVLLGNAGE